MTKTRRLELDNTNSTPSESQIAQQQLDELDARLKMMVQQFNGGEDGKPLAVQISELLQRSVALYQQKLTGDAQTAAHERAVSEVKEVVDGLRLIARMYVEAAQTRHRAFDVLVALMQHEAACKKLVATDRIELRQTISQLHREGKPFPEAEALLTEYDQWYAAEIASELRLHPVHTVETF